MEDFPGKDNISDSGSISEGGSGGGGVGGNASGEGSSDNSESGTPNKSKSSKINTSKTSGDEALSEDEEHELDFVIDVPLKVKAELGRLELTIKDLLSLNKGTVLELEKLAGEPLEIYINERLICKGEVIVIGEKYGIRMTDIVDPDENTEIKASTAQR
ncbi:MAG: flagellar motor switch protein FliN [Oligoflexia bacterium]|nr:flagellar motor switch protein FliN [Oligoflexia bacterium]